MVFQIFCVLHRLLSYDETRKYIVSELREFYLMHFFLVRRMHLHNQIANYLSLKEVEAGA